MARLCLVLGILWAVGCLGSGQDVATTVATTNAVTTGTTIAPTKPAAATTIASTIQPVQTTLAATAPPAVQTTPKITTAAAPSPATSPSPTSSVQASPTSKTDIPITVTTANLPIVTTKAQSVVTATSPTIKSDISTTSKASSTPGSSHTEGPTSPAATSPPKTTAAEGPKPPKPSNDTSPTNETKPATTVKSSSSPVPAGTTPYHTTSQTRPLPGTSFGPEAASSPVPKATSASPGDHVQRPDSKAISLRAVADNIQVKCTNDNAVTKENLKLHLKALRICNNTIELTKEEREAFKAVCKAVNSGSTGNCTVSVVETAGELLITEAIVEYRVSPSVLYKEVQSMKKENNSPLFSYENAQQQDTDEDVVSIPLISAIVSLAVALLIIAAIYGCYHQRQTRKREQRLTEELQTMENGYHDNPTLEVMETSPEMQEKKGGPNGELGDSWIVPLDNLTREDLEEEEDTHL